MITKGSRVKNNGKYHVLEEDKNTIFEVRSEPYNICGKECVLLKGRSGGYAVDGLTEVTDKELLEAYVKTGLLPHDIEEIDKLYHEKCKEVAHLRRCRAV